MATNIDERIVAAKFDASDFEKGVDKTVKKLDELKKSLDLKDATKGVEELAKKTETSTESMKNSLDKLTERFTTFVGMVKQKILSGLADEVAGVFLRMEQSVKSFIKSISTDQITNGMSKYQNMLTSVRQMVNAGYEENKVFDVLDRTQKYADETSYSFEQMSDAMAKMVSAGVGLDDAGKNVEGIANACANAGINASDASRAFYNLSQAFSTGKLHYTDYRSLELLNMTTNEFKEQMLEAAVAAGTLEKKVDKANNTIYKTTKKAGKGNAGKTVNLKNISEMLRYDWMTSDAMTQLFGKTYWMEVVDKDELAKLREELGDEEFEKRFGKIAVQAYQAAYEARSFVDVINAIKDAVSSGWSKTFEHLFGRLEEAKNFFTDLANGELADVVYKIADYRNAILGVWDQRNADNIDTGGKMFRDTIVNITEALGVFLKTLLQILPGMDAFGEDTDDYKEIIDQIGFKLQIFTRRVREFSEKIKQAAYAFNTFMNSPAMDDGTTKIELIRRVLSNLSSVFGIIGKVVVIAFETISKAFYTLSPIFDGFLVLLSKVTEPLVDLKNNTSVFKDVEHAIDNIFIVLEKVANVLGPIIGFLGEVGKFFVQMAIDTVTMNIQLFADALGLVLELLGIDSAQMKDAEAGGGVIAGIRKDLEGIKSACQTGLSAVKEFFGALLSDIKKLLGLEKEATEDQDPKDQNGGIFSGLMNFFNTNQFVQDAKAWVDQAIVDVGNFIKSIPERVMGLGANIYDTLRGLFFTEQTRYNGSMLETKEVLTPLGEWVVKAADDIKAWFKDLPNKIVNLVGKVGDWINEVFNYWFEKRTVESPHYENNGKGWEKKETQEIESRFMYFIWDVASSITNWFNDLPNKIKKAFAHVGNFIENLYKAVNDFLFGKEVTKTVKIYDPLTGEMSYTKFTYRYKTGFSKWLNGAVKEIKKFIKKIPEYVKAGIKGAGDLISTVIGALFGKPDDKEVTNQDVEKRLEKPFLGINLSNVLNTIRDIGKEILNQIARIFTGTDDVEANAEWFSNIVANAISWITEKATIAFNEVLKFISSIPTRIANLFNGESDGNEKQGTIGKAISSFGDAIGKFIAGIPTAVLGFVDSTIKEFDKVWKKFYDGVIGKGDEETKEVTKYAENEFGYPVSYSHRQTKTGWEKFVENLGKTISDAFTHLPVWISNGIELALEGLKGLFGKVTDWFKDHNVEEEAKKLTEDLNKGSTELAEGAEEAAEKTENKENPLWESIKNIGLSIFTLITETIPTMISEAWTWIGTKATEIWNGIGKIFSGQDIPGEEKKEAGDTLGEKIKTFIVETLPAKIQNAWSAVKQFAKDIFTGIHYIFTGEIPEDERSQSIKAIVDNIKKFILEDIPKAISDVWNGAFGNKDWKKNLNTTDDMYKQIVAAVESQERQANERLKQENKNPNVWSFFETIGSAILLGLSKALDWIGNIASIIVDALTGKKSIADQVEDAYGKEKPELREALTKIGESIRNFFLDTIPKFLGSAVGALAANAGEWISKLFSSFSAAAKAEEEKQEEVPEEDKDPVTGAKKIVDLFTTFLNNELFKIGVDAVKTIAIIFAIVSLLKALKDIFSLADEAEAAADVVKWTALAIAFAGLAGILSAVSSMYNSGDENKIKSVEGMLDKLTGLLDKVVWITGFLTAGKLIDAFSSGDGGSLAERVMGVFLDPISDFFKTVAVGLGGSLVSGIVGDSVTKMLERITESFGDLVYGIDDAIGIVEPLADKLSGMTGKLGIAIEAVDKIAELFKLFYQSFNNLYSEATGESIQREPGTDIYVTTQNQIKTGTEFSVGLESFLENMQSRIEMFTILAVFIDHLADALNKFSNISDVNSELNSMMTILTDTKFSKFLTTMLDTLKKSFDASQLDASSLGVADYLVPKYTSGVATGIEILANTLSVFANGMSGITDDAVLKYDKALEVFRELSNIFGDKKGLPDLAKIGNDIKVFGNQAKQFFQYIKDIPGFEENEIGDTQRKVDAVVNVAKQFSVAMNGLEYYKGSRDFIKDLSDLLPGYGEALSQFFISLNRGFELEGGQGLTSDRMSMLVSATEGFSSIISAVNGLAELMKYSYGGKSLSEIITEMFGDTNEKQSNLIDINKIASMIKAFDIAFIKVMETEDFADSYKTIGENIASKLAEGIQSAFDEDPELRIQITPVFKLDDDTKAQLKQQLTDAGFEFNTAPLAQSAQNANAQTDAERVKSSELYKHIDNVKSAVDELKESQATVDQITSAFAKLNMYINKNVLVGEIAPDIDAKIGEYIGFLNLGVTPP